jgi:ferritin-like metal-binding protein YciE
MAFATLNDVFVEQVEDLYSAENQLVDALPRIAQAVSDEQLRTAFEEHLEETRHHIRRLDEIIDELGISLTEKCKGMEGLLAEGEEIIDEGSAGPAKDAAIIAAAQRVEHYEIAAYGTARSLAGELGYGDAKTLLNETLNEESAADKLLTKIADGRLLRSGLNAQASAG